jgi:hypothetical protein
MDKENHLAKTARLKRKLILDGKKKKKTINKNSPGNL